MCQWLNKFIRINTLNETELSTPCRTNNRMQFAVNDSDSRQTTQLLVHLSEPQIDDIIFLF